MSKTQLKIQDPILAEWLNEFSSENTRATYRSALRKFKKLLDIENLAEYLNRKPNANKDIKEFLIKLNGRPSKTINGYVTALRVFLQDHDVEIENHNWRKLKRRGFFPKRVTARTRDKIPTKTELKKILNFADIKGRALFLFLASSGCRIGETLQLTTDDLDLNANPPRAFIRAETTKGGLGARTVFFSNEARDSINDWLSIKDKIHKKTGGNYSGKKVFPFITRTARYLWNLATKKAKLNQKDPNTNRRLYHLHSLRKFFRSKIGLDTDLIHALMGHSDYLDESYVRLNQEEIAEAYKKNMERVSMYAVEDLELRKEMQEKTKEIKELKDKLSKIENSRDSLGLLLRRVEELENKLEGNTLTQ